MNGLLCSWAAALGGEVSGKGVVCPGPGHSARDRSLSVTPFTTTPNGFLVNSFAGDDATACLDHVRQRLGLPEFRPGVPQKRALGGRHGAPGHRDSAEPKKAVSGLPSGDSYNHKLAMAIWAEARDSHGTLVEQHLKSRALELPGEAANEAIRFHPSCPFGKERAPAMIALMRGVLTNKPRAIQRTRLTPDGHKINRQMLGLAKDAAIKIDADEDITYGLHVGEGLETCLSGHAMGFRPVWALGGAGAIKSFPVLAGIDCLTLLAETDDTGANERVCSKCAQRWIEAGRECVIIKPALCGDLNDVIRKGPA